MMVGAMPVGRSYPGAATVAGLVQLEGARAAWKLSLIFFLSYNYFSLLSYFFIAFSFLSRKSNVMVKCVTEVTQRLDVDVDETHMGSATGFGMSPIWISPYAGCPDGSHMGPI